MKYEINRSKPEQKSFYYSGNNEFSEAFIGCLRIDFDCGDLFYSTWFDSENGLNDKEFKSEFDDVINTLRNSLLKSRRDMAEFIQKYGGEEIQNGYYGFSLNTEKSSFFLRCKPQCGDYDCYCYCYDKQQLELIRNQSQLPEMKL